MAKTTATEQNVSDFIHSTVDNEQKKLAAIDLSILKELCIESITYRVN